MLALLLVGLLKEKHNQILWLGWFYWFEGSSKRYFFCFFTVMRRNPFVVDGCCRKGSRNALQELYNPTQVGGQQSFHSISHFICVLFRRAPFSPSTFESAPNSQRTLGGSRQQIRLQSFSEQGQLTRDQKRTRLRVAFTSPPEGQRERNKH